MQALLDVNVLVALFDEEHTGNERAHGWLEENRAHGIATCPLTENGLVRILSHPNYSAVLKIPASQIVERLRNFVAENNHEFWPDSVSLRDPKHFDTNFILGPRQLTDLYLLALAVKQGGRLVTFDEGVHRTAIPGAEKWNLCVI